jgi:hypothetical protein
MEVTAHSLCVIAQTLECSSIQHSHPTASETRRGAHKHLHTTLTISICIEHQSRSAHSIVVTTHLLCGSSVQRSHPTASETQPGGHNRLHTTLIINICIEHHSRSARSMKVTAHLLCIIAQTLECSSVQRSHPTVSETQ